MPDDPKPAAHEPRQQPQQHPPGGAPQFATDYSQLSAVYTNFCRVSVTPEELVLDFGLNTQMTPNPAEPIKLTHRVVMNFFTAKRLMNALLGVIGQHESAYGVLELDFQRRARAAAARPGGMPPPPQTGIRPG